MKAKEAANFYLDKKARKQVVDKELISDNEKLLFIYDEFMKDMRGLIKIRSAKTEEALYSIIMETNGKWRAFVKNVNGKTKIKFGKAGHLNPAGFLKSLKDQSADARRILMKKGM